MLHNLFEQRVENIVSVNNVVILLTKFTKLYEYQIMNADIKLED